MHAPMLSVRPARGFTIGPPHTPTPVFNNAIKQVVQNDVDCLFGERLFAGQPEGWGEFLTGRKGRIDGRF
jgi:hypothetical protein